MVRTRWSCLALGVAAALAMPAAASAWVPDGSGVTAVSGHQYNPAAAPDGAGGVILAWDDYRNGATADVYAQRLDPQGVPLWGANGIPICTASGGQGLPVVVPDGAGGAYVVWSDGRTATIQVYAQRLDASGATFYPANGTLVGSGGEIRAIADGAGGAYVAWSLAASDIQLARLGPTSVGAAITVCNATQAQRAPCLALDGQGGVIVAWEDTRNGVLSSDIYAQRLDASGTALWTANGVGVSTASAHQRPCTIVADGAGGAIVAWTDERGGASTPDIYAQRMSAGGAALWTAGGVALVTAAGSQSAPRIVSDGAGGAVVAWVDGRATGPDIYAQRITASGTTLWTGGGVAACTAPLTQGGMEMVPDLLGGAILAWRDGRPGSGLDDVYAQRIDPHGAVAWSIDGVPLCTVAGYQDDIALVADGMGGIIVAWADPRGGSYDIYAQRVSAAAVVGPGPAGTWTPNGVPVFGSYGVQAHAALAGDRRGGVYVVSEDYGILDGGDAKLVVSRRNANGGPAWSSSTLASGLFGQNEPQALPDARGGVFVAWTDERGADLDLYAQSKTEIGFTGAGWPGAGLALCAEPGDQTRVRLVPDQVGGFLAVWEDRRSGTSDIYAQRVTAAGAPAAGWPVGGLALCAAAGEQLAPEACSDGVGGAIVVWQDGRGAGFDVYAVRVTGTGAIAAGWPAGGAALCSAGGDQTVPSICSDGMGGAIVAWEDRRSGSLDLYAQRVGATGGIAAGWIADGVALATGASEPSAPRVVSDGAAGAIVVWQQPGIAGTEIVAGHLTAAGLVPPGWTANGLVMSGAPGGRGEAVAAPDGRGGVIAAWQDARGGNQDLYAVRWMATGVRDPLFADEGTPMCLAGWAQSRPAIVADEAGGAFLAWDDERPDGDVYATHVLRAGPAIALAVAGERPPAAFRILAARPNPSRGAVTLVLEIARPAPLRLEILDPGGRRLRTLAAGTEVPAGIHAFRWDRRDAAGAPVPSGVYLVRAVSGGEARSTKLVTLD